MPHFYDPNQPRVLKGHEGAGRWTDDARSQPIDRDRIQPTAGNESQETAQPVFFRRGGPADPRAASITQALLAWFASASARNGPNQRAFIGFKAHVERIVKSEGNPDFWSEVSALKTIEETNPVSRVIDDITYGKSGSIRVDVLEKTKGGNVCVYDIKSGLRGLSGPRMDEIAWAVYERHGPRHIIVIEVRPSWMYGHR